MKKFPAEPCFERAQRLLPHSQLLRPVGEKPVPFMVLLHGCGSPNGPQLSYATALVEAGIACLIVDSYTPRQISRTEAVTRVCSGTMLWGRERAGDLLALFVWARSQDWVDASKLGAAGWSHGGWTIMDSLALGHEVGRYAGLTGVDEQPLIGLSHITLVYPWSGFGSQTAHRGWKTACPGIMILAGRDSVAGTRLPKKALASAKRSGAQIDLHEFEGATHSFDEQYSLNPTFVYDAELAAQAIALVRDRVVHDFGLKAV